MKKLLVFVLIATSALAYSTPPDEVLIDGRILLTATRPLDSYPWAHGRPTLSEYPQEGASDARKQAALWEISDGHLYLLGVRAFSFGPFAPFKTVGLRDLMPERLQEGKVFADWYTGDFVVIEPERIDPLIPRLEKGGPGIRVTSRMFGVVQGRVVEKKPNHSTEPAPGAVR